MSLTPSKAWVALDEGPPEIENEPGKVEVERTDPDEVAIHWLDKDEEQSTISLYLTKRAAVKVAHLLLAEAVDV